jgi:hypothetical protein
VAVSTIRLRFPWKPRNDWRAAIQLSPCRYPKLEGETWQGSSGGLYWLRFTDGCDRQFPSLRIARFTLVGHSEPVALARGVISASRDVRIDLVRGLALLMIFTDHILGNIVSEFSLHHVAINDALEVFIYLSGTSCGICFYGNILSRGFWYTQQRVLRRALTIYGAYLIVSFSILSIVLYSRSFMPDSVCARYRLVLDDPLAALVKSAVFAYTPGITGILIPYIALIPFLPIVLWLMQRSCTPVLGVSGAVWLCAQLHSCTSSPGSDTSRIA